MRPTLALLLTVLMLTACGKKGPLYMPDQPAGTPTEQSRK